MEYEMTTHTSGAYHSRATLTHVLRCIALASVVLSLQACAVVAVADAAVTVVATGVKVGVKAVGAVADAVIPDGK
jgi:hypothetical protein